MQPAYRRLPYLVCIVRANRLVSVPYDALSPICVELLILKIGSVVNDCT